MTGVVCLAASWLVIGTLALPLFRLVLACFLISANVFDLASSWSLCDDLSSCSLHSNSEVHVRRRQASLLTLTLGWRPLFSGLGGVQTIVSHSWHAVVIVCFSSGHAASVTFRDTHMIAPCSASLVLHFLHSAVAKNHLHVNVQRH